MEEKKENKDSVEQSSWNLSEIIINQIGSLLNKSQVTFMQQNYGSCYSAEREIVMLIFADLSPEEIAELGKREKLIIGYLKLATPAVLSRKRIYETDLKIKEFLGRDLPIQECRDKLYEYLTEYRQIVRRLLSKYGYGAARKEDSTKMF